MPQATDLDAFAGRLEHAAHRRLFEYWCSKAQPGRLPGRQAIDPIEIADLLPRIGLLDVVRDPEGTMFRYRLLGTGITARAGRDVTGKRFDELYDGPYLERQLTLYREIADQGIPFESKATFPLERDYIRYDRLVLPLASDGRAVDVIMFLLVFDNTVPPVLCPTPRKPPNRR